MVVCAGGKVLTEEWLFSNADSTVASAVTKVVVVVGRGVEGAAVIPDGY